MVHDGFVLASSDRSTRISVSIGQMLTWNWHILYISIYESSVQKLQVVQINFYNINTDVNVLSLCLTLYEIRIWKILKVSGQLFSFHQQQIWFGVKSSRTEALKRSQMQTFTFINLFQKV